MMWRESTTGDRAVLVGSALCGGVLILATPSSTSTVVLYLTVTALSLVFAVTYGLRSNWRATAAGRALMYVTLSFASFGAYVLASYYFGPFCYRDTVRDLLLLGLAVVFVNLNLTLRRAQRIKDEAQAQEWANLQGSAPDRQVADHEGQSE